jgi:hypothetical protein
MNTLRWIVLVMASIGLPSIFTMVVWIVRRVKKLLKQMIYLMSACKATIRQDLLNDFLEYEERCQNGGSITLMELDEWMNRYKAYHQLVGDNGVLDDKYIKMLEFKNKP